MYKSIQTTHHLAAPADKIWQEISSGEAWERWLPILTGSKTEGNKRFCYMDNGDTLEESFLASHVERTFIYTIHKQSSFPAENIVGIIRLEDFSAEETTLHWSVDMQLTQEEAFPTLKEHITQIYTTSAQKLADLVTATV